MRYGKARAGMRTTFLLLRCAAAAASALPSTKINHHSVAPPPSKRQQQQQPDRIPLAEARRKGAPLLFHVPLGIFVPVCFPSLPAALSRCLLVWTPTKIRVQQRHRCNA